MGGSSSNLINIKKIPLEDVESMEGKRALIVGGTNGLGLAIAKALASEKANVTVAGRKDPAVENLAFVKADLTLVKDMEDFVSKVESPETIDFLVFTTGVFATPKLELTSEGVERDFAISYLSRYVLFNGLAKRGLRPTTKVCIMGFPGNGEMKIDLDDFQSIKKYAALKCHFSTTVDNEALVLAMKDKFLCFGLNPGLIETGIRRDYTGNGAFANFLEKMIGMLNITPDQYAVGTVVPLLKVKASAIPSGTHFSQKGVQLPPNPWLTEENVNKIMSLTEDVYKPLAGSASIVTN